MTIRTYKYALVALAAFLAVNTTGFAQEITLSQPGKQDLTLSVKAGVKSLVNNIVVTVNDIAPKINSEVDSYVKEFNTQIVPEIKVQMNDLKDLDFDFNPSINNNDFNNNSSANSKQKIKNYSKSYPLDGNDRIKLSNQYGRIIVNTWEKNEVKVDVTVKAEADNDDDAQKLLDGVQIRDSKDGDQVSFRTSIEPNSNNSWKIWNWGGKKNHKLEINYTVYMPAKTDLNVEDSYGAIQLPDLSGRVKINSSYGSVLAQNLSNPSNDIQGSYGSLKAAAINGARLDYSYGSVDLDECTNIKGVLSYGSFKLGKLKGAADLNLSYMGGFKIDEMATSFKKLDVNSSYSGVSLGVPGGNNFDFDITTTYGGFSYDDNKVTITSKNPPDGSKHIGPTRNYKGHFGKGSADAQVIIHTTYGGVNFD
jgi:hypothetical protein